MAVPWWRARPLTEAVLATFVAAFAVFGTSAELGHSSWQVANPPVGYVLAVAACAPLPLRRRHPVPVTLAVLALVFGYHLMGFPGEALGIALFVAVYSVAAYGGPRSLPVAAALTVVAGAAPTIPPHAQSWSDPAVYGPTIGMLCVAILGGTVRQRRVDAEERVRQARAAATAEMHRRLTDERLRIARELHDVLAHTISVIAVQGGLALDALDDNPRLARTAVTTMRSSAREALAELRAALTALRGGAETTGTAPQPHLRDLPTLADAARAAGLTVHLDLAAAPDGLLPAVELTAYRIVQEALTNVVRHAGAGSVWVCLRREAGALRVEVSDDGRGLSGQPDSGMGLRGMRERAEALGGRLTLGARDGGGCRILAVLPL
jgi:signal transduction histidine kinase